MAKCDEGYLCEVCGRDVASLLDSDLYLRYVVGMIDPEELHVARERHIRCNPTLAQFIVDDEFEPIELDGPFAKYHLDTAYVSRHSELLSRGYRRLKELLEIDLPVIDYPLPEVRDHIQNQSGQIAPATRHR